MLEDAANLNREGFRSPIGDGAPSFEEASFRSSRPADRKTLEEIEAAAGRTVPSERSDASRERITLPSLSYAEVRERVFEAFAESTPDWKSDLVLALKGSLDLEVQKKIVRMFEEWTPDTRKLSAQCCDSLSKDAQEDLRATLRQGLARINFQGWGIREFFHGSTSQSDVDTVISIFQKGDVNAQRECIQALQGNGNETAVSFLVDIFTNLDSLESHRFEAIAAMRGISSPSVTELLVAELSKLDPVESETVSDWNLFPHTTAGIGTALFGRSKFRSEAARALTGTDDPRAIRALVRGLSDSNESVAFYCAEALGGTSDPKAISKLLDSMLAPGTGTLTREACAISLRGCEDRKTVNRLASALSHPDLGEYAAVALEGTADIEAQKKLRAILSDAAKPAKLRGRCAAALTAATDPATLASLENGLSASDAEIVAGCSKGLTSGAGGHEIRTTASLFHPDLAIRHMSRRMLQGRLHPDACSELLTKASDPRNADLIHVLAGSNDAKVVSHLKALLQDPQLKERAAIALGADHAEARPVLIEALSSSERKVRNLALRELGKYLGGTGISAE